jgi:hypothetical protein
VRVVSKVWGRGVVHILHRNHHDDVPYHFSSSNNDSRGNSGDSSVRGDRFQCVRRELQDVCPHVIHIHRYQDGFLDHVPSYRNVQEQLDGSVHIVHFHNLSSIPVLLKVWRRCTELYWCCGCGGSGGVCGGSVGVCGVLCGVYVLRC